MNISKRLQTIAKFISLNSIVYDCGTDHALLPIYLSTNNLVKKVYAVDISEKALTNAKSNISKYSGKSIDLVLCDGLSKLPEDVNTIVIAGMGAHTITNILKGNIKNTKTIIIQTNNDIKWLRKKLYDMLFKIVDEALVFDNNKYYEIMVVEPGTACLSDSEALIGPVLIKKTDKLYVNYINNQIAKLSDLLKKIPKSDPDYYLVLKDYCIYKENI